MARQHSTLATIRSREFASSFPVTRIRARDTNSISPEYVGYSFSNEILGLPANREAAPRRRTINDASFREARQQLEKFRQPGANARQLPLWLRGRRGIGGRIRSKNSINRRSHIDAVLDVTLYGDRLFTRG